mmetsp:Transcript_60427/g.112214  ORF Transcript_60427/g.112214 Transcript_60427/m.112214 type:complete len:458 (-) Transcript_60427:16-1389(-)
MLRVLSHILSSGPGSTRPNGKSANTSESTRDLVFQAAGLGNAKAVMVYRQQGIPIAELEDRRKSNLLHVAAREGQVELLGLLVTLPEFLGMINLQDKARRTPLHLAAAIGHDEVVALLLRCGAHRDPMDDSCWTPLHWAVYGDHGVVCEALLSAKADPLKKAGSQPSAMELLAVNDGDSEAREVFDRLVLAKIKQQMGVDDTAEGDAEAAREVPLEQRGAWVAFKDASGETYYWNRRDNTTNWKLPSAAKVAWYAFRTDDGGVYYWYAKTQQTVWNLPLMYRDDIDSDNGSDAGGVQHTVVGIPDGLPRQGSANEPEYYEEPLPGVPQHQEPTSPAPAQEPAPKATGGQQAAMVPTLPPQAPPPQRPPRRAPGTPQQDQSQSKASPEEEPSEKKESPQADKLQAEISKAILAEDELGLQASIEMARGILEENSLADAMAALERVKKGTAEAQASTGQ